MTKRLLLLISCLLLIPLQAQASDTQNTEVATFEPAPDIVVEGFRLVLPKRTDKALSLLPYSWLDKFDSISKPDENSGIKTVSTHDYYQNKLHLNQSGDTTPYTKIHLFDNFFDWLSPLATTVLLGLMVFAFSIKVYDATQSINSTDQKVEDHGVKKMKFAFMEAGLFSIILLYTAPNVIDGGAFTVVPIMAVLLAWFTGTIALQNILLAMISLSSTTVDPELYEYKLEQRLGEIQTSIVEVAQGKIIHDALLDTSLKEHQFIGGKGVYPASNQALMDIGEAQQKLERSRGVESSRADCLLLDNWSQKAHSMQECAWVLQADTDYGIIPSRLQVNYQEPIGYETLNKTEQYMLSKTKQLVSDEVVKYTEHKKGEICVGRHGQRSHQLDMRNSLFCAKRDAQGWVLEGEYYGYESDTGGYYQAVSAFNKPDDEYSWETFDAEMGKVILGLYHHFAAVHLKENQEALKTQHDRGLLLTLPKMLGSIQNKKRNEYVEAFIGATTTVKGYLTKGALKQHFSEYPLHDKKLFGISDIDEVDRYLSRHYPYARSVWFENLPKVDIKLSALVKDQISRVDGENLIGEMFSSMGNLLTVGVTFSAADLIAGAANVDISFVGTLGNALLLLALIVYVCIALVFFGFLFKFVIQHMLLRVLTAPFLFIIEVVKSLIDDIKNRDKAQEIDLVGVAYIKSQMLNPFIKIAVGINAWIIGVMMLPVAGGLSQNLVSMMPWLSSEGVFTYVLLQVFILPVVFCVIGYQLCYKMPFKFYSYMTAGIEDSMSNIGEENDNIVGFYNRAKIHSIAKRG
jgi:hypothetical protein